MTRELTLAEARDRLRGSRPEQARSHVRGDLVEIVRAAVLALLLALPAAAAEYPTQEAHPISPRSAGLPMTGPMHALRGEVQRLQAQMERIEHSTEPAERRKLTQQHLVDLKAALSKLHAMELQMIDDVRKGRVVSDIELSDRQRILAEQTSMALEMLEQAIKIVGSAAR